MKEVDDFIERAKAVIKVLGHDEHALQVIGLVATTLINTGEFQTPLARRRIAKKFCDILMENIHK